MLKAAVVESSRCSAARVAVGGVLERRVSVDWKDGKGNGMTSNINAPLIVLVETKRSLLPSPSAHRWVLVVHSVLSARPDCSNARQRVGFLAPRACDRRTEEYCSSRKKNKRVYLLRHSVVIIHGNLIAGGGGDERLPTTLHGVACDGW